MLVMGQHSGRTGYGAVRPAKYSGGNMKDKKIIYSDELERQGLPGEEKQV